MYFRPSLPATQVCKLWLQYHKEYYKYYNKKLWVIRQFTCFITKLDAGMVTGKKAGV